MVAKVALAGCVAVLLGAGLAGCGSSGAAGGAAGPPATRPLPTIVPGILASPTGSGAGGSGGQVPGGQVPGGLAVPASGGTGGVTGSAGSGRGGPGGTGAGAASTAPPCAAPAVSLAQLPGGTGAAGQMVVAVQVRNVSPVSCSLSGYPSFTVSARASTGAEITEPVTLHHGPQDGLAFGDAPGTVDVAAHGHAGFLVDFSQVQYGDGSCVPVDQLHLSLPGGAEPVVGPVHMQVCGEPMLVSPFVPPARLSTG